MRTVKWMLALLFFSGFLNTGGGFAQSVSTQTPGAADAISLPNTNATTYSLAQRGPDHCVWQKVSVAGTNQAGQTVYRINQYTELGTGMSVWRNGRWVAASPALEITATGAQAINGIHQLFFPATVASGGIDLLMPDSQHLVTQLSGLSYFDPDSGTNLWIGLLQDAQGYLLPTNNSVLYQDVFNGGFRVDAIYENNLAGGEQNLILREQIPPPSAWGLSDDSCRLLAWTEILNGPEMRVDEQQLDDGTVVAKLIYLGRMFIGPGKAFLTDSDLSSTNRAILVDKQVVRSGARTFLVESLKYAAIAPSLATLPPPAGPGTNAQARLGGTLRHGLAQVPPRLLARQSFGPMKVASLPLPKKGLLWDYSTLNFNTNQLTLQADQTYLVTSAVNVTNLSVEGGCVVKYTRYTNSNPATISAINTLACLTGPFRPATFTSIDDNSIGEVIPGSTGNHPANFTYANPALSVMSTNVNSLQYMRFFNTWNGIACYSGQMTLTNMQFINSADAPIFWGASGTCNLYNALAYQFLTVIDMAQHVNFNMQHVTADVGENTAYGSSTNGSATQTATNCLFVNIDLSTPPFTMSTQFNFWTNFNGFMPFQTTGAGTHYLLANSPFAAMGTTNIDTNLLAQIRRKTVWPPSVFGGGAAAAYFSNTNLVLSPSVQRDTGPGPSLGFHYDVLDYAFGDLFFTNTTVTVSGGTVIGTFSAVTNGTGYGLGIGNGAQFLSTGSPTNLNRVVRYNMVQDQLVTNWSSASYGSILSSWITNTPVPVINCRFTDFSAPAQDVHHFYGWSGNTSPLPFNFQDCQFHGGLFESQYPTINLTNNLFERVKCSLYCGDSNIPYIRNNLFWGGTFDLALFGATNGAVRDNFFDGTHIPDEGNTGYNGGYNAYNNSYGTNTDRLTPTNATDIVLTSTVAYQTGPLGKYYYPTNDGNLSRLINAGSVTADQVGLYHFTTQTNQLKETNTVVDIGWHVVAVNTNGLPFDANNDGIPDYLQDANGNGKVDSGETSWINAGDWGLKVLITRPKNNSIIP